MPDSARNHTGTNGDVIRIGIGHIKCKFGLRSAAIGRSASLICGWPQRVAITFALPWALMQLALSFCRLSHRMSRNRIADDDMRGALRTTYENAPHRSLRLYSPGREGVIMSPSDPRWLYKYGTVQDAPSPMKENWYTSRP